MTSFLLDYLCKVPISKKVHILKYWGLGLQHIIFFDAGGWGTYFNPYKPGFMSNILSTLNIYLLLPKIHILWNHLSKDHYFLLEHFCTIINSHLSMKAKANTSSNINTI